MSIILFKKGSNVKMIGTGSVLTDRYELGQRIGKGGFAVVYLARDLVLQREVAVKVIIPNDIEESSDDGATSNRLLDLLEEARFVARHRHPNILDVYDFGQVEDEAYLVMPFAAGGTLLQKLRQTGPLSFPQTSLLLDQMASALDYAHSLGVVHRDIKPQNILMFNQQQVAVSDFGIAKILNDTSGYSNTRASGTPSYMAPEQFAGRISKYSDIYSLAVVTYQMLTANLPFKAESQAGLMYNVLNNPAPPLRQSRPDTPLTLEEVFKRAMNKEPTQRPHSAGEFAQQFRQALNPIPNTAQPPLGSSDATMAIPPPRPAVTPLPSAPAAQQPQYQIPNAQPAIITPAVYYVQPALVTQSSPPLQTGSSVAVWLGLGGLALVVVVLGVIVSLLLLGNNKSAIPTALALVTTPPVTTSTIIQASIKTDNVTTIVVTSAPLSTGVTNQVTIEATTAPPPTAAFTSLLNIGGKPIKGRLVFNYEDNVNGKHIFGIKTRNIENGQEQALFSDGSSPLNPAWASNGRVVFSFNSTIIVMNDDGSNRQELPVNGLNPTWSPDGQHLLYIVGREIYIADANGQNPTPLTSDNAEKTAPVFSPDGTKIAYSRVTSGLWQIWVADANGQNARQASSGNENARFPSWSPDGQQLAYHIADGSLNPVQIWVMNADGSGPKPLTARDGSGRPFWNYDNLIFFHSYRANSTKASLYVMLPDGTEQKAITGGQLDYYGVSWKP